MFVVVCSCCRVLNDPLLWQGWCVQENYFAKQLPWKCKGELLKSLEWMEWSLPQFYPLYNYALFSYSSVYCTLRLSATNVHISLRGSLSLSGSQQLPAFHSAPYSAAAGPIDLGARDRLSSTVLPAPLCFSRLSFYGFYAWHESYSENICHSFSSVMCYTEQYFDGCTCSFSYCNRLGTSHQKFHELIWNQVVKCPINPFDCLVPWKHILLMYPLVAWFFCSWSFNVRWEHQSL